MPNKSSAAFLVALVFAGMASATTTRPSARIARMQENVARARQAVTRAEDRIPDDIRQSDKYKARKAAYQEADARSEQASESTSREEMIRIRFELDLAEREFLAVTPEARRVQSSLSWLRRAERDLAQAEAENRGDPKALDALVVVEYDKFRDVTAVRTRSLELDSRSASLSLEYWSGYPGQKQVRPAEHVLIVFGSSSDEWMFLDVQTIIFLIDGERFRLPVTHSGRVGNARVTEVVSVQVDPVLYAKFTSAKTVEFQLGQQEIQLPEEAILWANALKRKVQIKDN